jgi:hypothetical protein
LPRRQEEGQVAKPRRAKRPQPRPIARERERDDEYEDEVSGDSREEGEPPHHEGDEDGDEDEVIDNGDKRIPRVYANPMDDPDFDWGGAVRKEIATLLRPHLMEGQSFQQALLHVRGEFLSMVTGLQERHVAHYTAWGESTMNDLSGVINTCAPIGNAYNLMIRAEGIPSNANTVVFKVGIRELYTDMVMHATQYGVGALDDPTWKLSSTVSLKTAEQIWNSFISDGLVAQPTTTAPLKPMVWSEAQLAEYQHKRVKSELEQMTCQMAKLSGEPQEHEFLRWLLSMGKLIMKLEVSRRSIPLHERVWRELAAEIRVSTPERWQSINDDVDTLTSPYVLIERLLSKIKYLAPTAALLMKEHLSTIINGEFWKAAQYAIDTLRIERLSHYTNLQQWVTEVIPLTDIKLRLQSTANITHERRSCIGSYDESFDSMCERVEALSRSQVGLKSSSALRINAIEHEEDTQGSQYRYQKNGRGLAQGARYHKHDAKEEEGDHEAGHHRKNDWFGRGKEYNNKWSNSRGKWSDKREDNRYGKGGRKNRFGKGGKVGRNEAIHTTRSQTIGRTQAKGGKVGSATTTATASRTTTARTTQNARARGENAGKVHLTQ